jgi:hypothetical protein
VVTWRGVAGLVAQPLPVLVVVLAGDRFVVVVGNVDNDDEASVVTWRGVTAGLAGENAVCAAADDDT